MILSFHPLFAADRQIICAGRAPGPDERQAISAATAVILPQACRQDLYEMVRENCALYFPNYDARFAYPGKTGQHLLFKKAGVPHPRTISFSDTRAFRRQCRRIPDDLPFGFPCVFKFDWGGEGETVFPVNSESGLKEFLCTASAFERTGQSGFLHQEMIPAGNRSLRVAVIGRRCVAYWRVQPDREIWCANLAHGGQIDFMADPELRASAVSAVRNFCRFTRIDLAGFDLLFPEGAASATPFFLEINYFFGRRGLGGSEAYYRILVQEIDSWIRQNGLETLRPGVKSRGYE
jgi:ribosomal protein S6--L-glutamate ligase